MSGGSGHYPGRKFCDPGEGCDFRDRFPQTGQPVFKKIKVQTNQVRNTLIVGGGKITFYLATLLLSMGIDVKIIENNRERCEHLSELLPQATIICGDGVDQALLLEEGLLTTDSW